MHPPIRACLLALTTSPLLAEEPTRNLCQDPAANRAWGERLAAHPEDALLIRLFALRQGLCWRIDQGLLTVDQGTDRFERERGKAIIERLRESERRQRDPVL